MLQFKRFAACRSHKIMLKNKMSADPSKHPYYLGRNKKVDKTYMRIIILYSPSEGLLGRGGKATGIG